MADFPTLEEEDIQLHKLKLHAYSYKAASSPKGIVFISHGLGEHTLRHKKHINMFAAEGFNVFALDLPDHGKSANNPGEPSAYIESFPNTVDSWVTYVENISSTPGFENLPKFFIGHSLGGTLGILIGRRVKKLLNGVILSAPTVYMNKSGTLIFLLKMVGKVWGRAPVQTISLSTLSHDPQIIEDAKNDKFYVKTAVPARTGIELYNGTVEISQHYDQDDYPMLLVHGELDELAPIKNSELFYEKAASKDKTFKRFPGMLHEIHNESCWEELRQCILTWVGSHLAKSDASSSSSFSNTSPSSSSSTL